MATKIRIIYFTSLLVICYMIIHPAYANAQSSWAHAYGSSGYDYGAQSIQQTSDGGYIAAGYANSFGAGNADMWILKLNSFGNIAWQKTYGGYSWDYANSIQQTSDGGYIVAGYTESYGAGAGDVWILKLDSSGNVIWQKTYGGTGADSGGSIQQTSDGGYIVAGSTESFGAGNDDMWILKLNASGNVIWQKTYGGTGADGGGSIQQTSDGGYIVAGYTNSFGAGNADIWILKLDASGNALWKKTYGGSSDDWAYSIQQTSDGGYIVAATTGSFGAGWWDFWVLKLDSSGNIVWQKTYGGSGYDFANSMQLTGDGGYIIAGFSYSFSAGPYDIWILKLDSSGNVVWQKTYGGSGDDYAYSIQQTSDGGYIVAGLTNSFGAGYGNFLILKLNPDGTMSSSCSFINNTNINPVNSSATSANTDAAVSSPSITITNTGIAGIYSSATNTFICSSCPLPGGLTNNTAIDLQPCMHTGVHLGWNVDAANWGDGGAGTRTYDVLRDGIAIASSLPYGMTASIDTSGTHGQTYIYKVRYINGCGSPAATAGVHAADYPGPPTAMNTIAHDKSPQFDTGVDISWSIPTDWGDDAANNNSRGFRVYRDSIDISGLLPASTLIYEDTNGINNTYYTYHVDAINGCGITNSYNSMAAIDAVTQVADWAHIYGGSGTEWTNAIRQTSDGGYIIAGLTNSFGAGTCDFWILKLDSSGNALWQKTYGGSLDDWAYSIQETSDSGYIVAGWTRSFGTFQDAWILKLDSSGNIVWQKTYSGSSGSGDDYYANSIQQTHDGGYIVSGAIYNIWSDIFSSWVLKLDAFGNITWQKSYGVYEFAYSIQQTNDGGYIVAGGTGSFGAGHSDFWVLKLDSSGDIVWQQAYGGENSDFAYSIQQTSDGGYIAAGVTESFGNGGYDMWILKLNASGNITWQKTYGGSSTDYGSSIKQTSDGGYIVAGGTGSFGAGNGDIWILKLDISGNIIWQNTYGGSSDDYANSIQQTSDGGYIVAAGPGSFGSGHADILVLKLNPYGTLNSSCTFINNSSINPVDSIAFSANTSATVVSTSCIVNNTNVTGVNSNGTDFLLCASELFLKPYNDEKPVVIDAGSPTANGIIEPDELVELAGTLENTGSSLATSVTGLLASASPIIISNPDATYPDILSNDHKTCTSCYSLTAPLVNRWATHWDIEVTENVSAMHFGPLAYHYLYHVGNSFSDVPTSYLFYSYIEKLLHIGVTSGCTDNTYCPDNNVLREQMAKFICASMEASHSGTCQTSSCSGVFTDVLSSNPFCPYIEQLYNMGIVAGCQIYPSMYCPSAALQRQAMAKFVCLAMQSANPGSCGTASCTGIFTDVPPTNPFCTYIEALYNTGILSGCGANTYCPTSFVSRGQMAKFLANGFGFEL